MPTTSSRVIVVGDGEVAELRPGGAVGPPVSTTDAGARLLALLVESGPQRVNRRGVIVYDGNAPEVLGELMLRALDRALAHA